MAKEFKSRTFRFGFPEGEAREAFTNDLNNLKEIDKSKIEDAVSYVKKIIKSNTQKERNEIYDAIVDLNIVKNYSTIYSFYRLSKNFFDALSNDEKKSNELEFIIEDISIEFDLDEKNLSVLKVLLDTVNKDIEWYKKEELKGDFEKGLFPNLKGIGTTVELRGVFNREIKYGEKSEEYLKNVEIVKNNPLIPIISVALTLDSGNPERFCFQLSPRTAEWLIEELKAALIKTEKLKGKYNI